MNEWAAFPGAGTAAVASTWVGERPPESQSGSSFCLAPALSSLLCYFLSNYQRRDWLHCSQSTHSTSHHCGSKGHWRIYREERSGVLWVRTPSIPQAT